MRKETVSLILGAVLAGFLVFSSHNVESGMSATELGELMRELNISGEVSPQMADFLQCMYGGPVVSLWDKLTGKEQPWGDEWDVNRIRRTMPGIFQWWTQECMDIAY